MLKKIYYWLHRKVSKSEERGEHSAGYLQNKVRETALSLLKQDKGIMLEVGCGEGLFLKKIINKPGLELFGIDLSFEQLSKAKKRLNFNDQNNFKLYLSDAANLPFKDKTFKVIICINVLLNLPSEFLLDKVLKEISRVCVKEGRIIFDFRNCLNPLLYLRYKLAKYYDATVDSNRLRMHTMNKIENKLKSLGMNIVKKEYIGWPKGKFSPIIVLEAKKANV